MEMTMACATNITLHPVMNKENVSGAALCESDVYESAWYMYMNAHLQSPHTPRLQILAGHSSSLINPLPLFLIPLLCHLAKSWRDCVRRSRVNRAWTPCMLGGQGRVETALKTLVKCWRNLCFKSLLRENWKEVVTSKSMCVPS